MKAVWDGQPLVAVCRAQHLQRKTLGHWLDQYLHGGFRALLARPRRPRAQTLGPQRKRVLRFIVLHKTPHDYGFDRYPWTAPLIQALLEQKWQVTLSRTRVYELLAELGLSHQRAHRDDGPGRTGDRQRFAEALKKTVAWSPRPPSSP